VSIIGLPSSESVKEFSIDINSSGDNTLVALVTGKRIRVLSYLLVADAAVSARWKSGASTNKSGAMALAANGKNISSIILWHRLSGV